MPAVNNVGEPCAGEPHARFDAAGAGNGANLTGIRGPRAGVLQNATTTAWAGTTRQTTRHRASARPYTPLVLMLVGECWVGHGGWCEADVACGGVAGPRPVVWWVVAPLGGWWLARAGPWSGQGGS